MTATFIHPLTGFIEKTFVITEFELRKLRHDFTEPRASLVIHQQTVNEAKEAWRNEGNPN